MSNILPIIPISKAVDNAILEINDGLKDEQAGLLCRWDKVNKVILGSWRFNNIYTLAGSSGSGKSWILNMLRSDFANKELNKNFKKKIRQIHFAFEMTASDEIIRTASGAVKTSYGDLISAYSKLSEIKYKETIEYLKTLRDLEIDFVEVSGNIQQIYDTIAYYQGLYTDHSLIISIDHGLLTSFKNESSEVELVSKLFTMLVDVRKKFAPIIIPLSQLNTEIEDPKRISIPAMHFPVKRDLHGSKNTFFSSDYVFVIHDPEKLGIESYGRQEYDTKNRVFLHAIKTRKTQMEGIIGWQKDFGNGNLIQLDKL